MAKLTDLPDVLTVAEVAEFLKIPETRVRELIRQGKLRAVKFGRGYRITADAVRQLIVDMEYIPAPAAGPHTEG